MVIPRRLRSLLEAIAHNTDAESFLGTEQKSLRQLLAADHPALSSEAPQAWRSAEIEERWFSYERRRFEEWALVQVHFSADLSSWQPGVKEIWGRYRDEETQRHWLTWRGCARRFFEGEE